MPKDSAVLAAFDRLFDAAIAAGQGSVIDYTLPQPRWQFICHLADTRDIVVHGSPNHDIALFEPRQTQDETEFGNQKAVYAASDGLWPIYFAILDRGIHPMSTINASLKLEGPEGLSEPLYYFSITRAALEKRAFGRGMVYFLPRHSFTPQPPEQQDGQLVHIAQWVRRSDGETVNDIPVRMHQTRRRQRKWESPVGLLCQAGTTRNAHSRKYVKCLLRDIRN